MTVTIKKKPNVQHGAVLVFPVGTTKNEVTEILASISLKLGYMPKVNEFNPDYGGPVWYIP